MFNNVKLSVQRAFFDSLEKAGCLSLETENPESSSDEEDEEWDEKKHGKKQGETEHVEEDGDEDDEDDDDDDDEEEEDDGGDSNSEEESKQARFVDTPTRVVGFGSFLRRNPRTDKFGVERIHHVEFWCADATSTASRFSWALGVPMVAKSDLSTGNNLFCSVALKCGELALCFSAPQSSAAAGTQSASPRVPFPYTEGDTMRAFVTKHGLAVRALAVEVPDVTQAYDTSIQNGAEGVADPVHVLDPASGSSFWVAEVKLTGDVVLRFLKTTDASAHFLPMFTKASNHVMSYGLSRLDHAVCAVQDLQGALSYIKNFTGFHDFEDEEVQTPSDKGNRLSTSTSKKPSDSDYAVLANNTETVVVPLVAPGARSQPRLLSFLQYNNGPGIQHLAVMCTDIVQTVQEMKARSELGGFQFHPRPPGKYYKELKARLGTKLSQHQLEKYQELGILVDLDDRGILLQIFTKPVCDRPTFSLEIVQRISHKGGNFPNVGCGGFGTFHDFDAWS